MGNCLNSCHEGATEEDFEPSRCGYSADLESKMQREKEGVLNVKKSSISKEEKGVVRVKIVLSKQDAARLLCKLEGSGDGDVLGAAISELKSTKSDHMGVVGHEPCGSTWKPLLESIPENSLMY
ncbi:hypothetical protein AAC387_Pa12g1861 [Persea americana]